MSWTNVSKPTGANWTRVNVMGNQTYDDSSLTYDSASTFYDSINPTAWTNISKPTGGFTITPGFYMGCLGLTYSKNYPAGGWRLISKPT